jgi:hypothetical protein
MEQKRTEVDVVFNDSMFSSRFCSGASGLTFLQFGQTTEMPSVVPSELYLLIVNDALIQTDV